MIRHQNVQSSRLVIAAILTLIVQPASVFSATVFSENFDGQAVGDKTHADFSDTGPPFTFGAASASTASGANNVSVVADTGNANAVFGESNVNFLRMEDGNTNNAPRMVGQAPLNDTAFQWSFDFRDLGASGEDHRISTALTDNILSTQPSGRIIELQIFSGGDLDSESNPRPARISPRSNSDKAVLVTPGNTYQVTVVGNFTAADVIYADGAETVMSRHFDIWLDGDLMSKNVPMTNAGDPTSSGTVESTHLAIYGASNGAVGQGYFDNVLVTTDVTITHAIPEPGGIGLACVALLGVAAFGRWKM